MVINPCKAVGTGADEACICEIKAMNGGSEARGDGMLNSGGRAEKFSHDLHNLQIVHTFPIAKNRNRAIIYTVISTQG